MAGNSLMSAFKIQELRSRIAYTIMMLLVFRLGVAIPLPGIDLSALLNVLSSKGSAEGGLGFGDYFDFFAGGGFSRLSIFMLGVMPYISASIIMQLLLIISPRLKRIIEEDGGRKKMQKYTRYGTLAVCVVQSFVIVQTINGYGYDDVVTIANPYVFYGIAFVVATVGTLFLMWMGEQITQKGIGNGVSLIIFVGIVARIPDGLKQLFRSIANDQTSAVYALLVGILFVIVVGLVVYEQQGKRKIQVNYAKRVVGRKMYGAQSSYIPLKINPSGVIPVIFASSVMQFLLIVAGATGWDWFQRVFQWGSVPYMIIEFTFIVMFGFVYTQATLNPVEIAKNIRENGGSIPGVRTEHTEEYLRKVINRIVLPGSMFLGFIAITPTIVWKVFNIPAATALIMGGTSLIIIVGVALDTVAQIEGHLKMHHQDGIVKGGRIRSRNL
ncbi:MAG: preprotein translocase subunit SecY [Spirochaetales bacterium]|nr:preprotein translocase subunit SecY [Spirochaetales bacterium]